MDERKRPAQPEGGSGENDNDDQTSSNASSSDSDVRLNRKVAASSHAAVGAVVTSSSKAHSSEEKTTGSDDEAGGQEERAKKRMRTSEATSQENKVSHEQRWNEMFARLRAYRAKHGNCLVPNRYPEDSQLGFWVSAQRRQYKIALSSGEGSSALTPERARRLESIGFEWSTSNPHHTPWENRYQELCRFVKKYRHAEVPMRWRENPQLSHWVSKQRHDFKLRQQGKSSRLNDKKMKLLNDLGFLWEGSRRSLKDKISLASDNESETELEPGLAAVPTAHVQAGTLPLGSNTQVPGNFAFVYPLVAAGNTTAAAAPTAQSQLQGLTTQNIAQLILTLTGSQQAQPSAGAGTAVAPAPALFSTVNSGQAPVGQAPGAGYADSGSINNVLNLVSQLIAPRLTPPQQQSQQTPMQQQPLFQQEHQPVLMQQQSLLQLPIPHQQQQQQQQPASNLASGIDQQALIAALQQAIAGGQIIPIILGGGPPGGPGPPTVASTSNASQPHVLQLGGYSSMPNFLPAMILPMQGTGPPQGNISNIMNPYFGADSNTGGLQNQSQGLHAPSGNISNVTNSLSGTGGVGTGGLQNQSQGPQQHRAASGNTSSNMLNPLSGGRGDGAGLQQNQYLGQQQQLQQSQQQHHQGQQQQQQQSQQQHLQGQQQQQQQSQQQHLQGQRRQQGDPSGSCNPS